MSTTTVSPVDLEQQSDAVRKHASAEAPAPLKMMAARGMAAMGAGDAVVTQFLLTFDPEEPIARAAEKSLAELPQQLAAAVLGDAKLPQPVLHHLALLHATNDAYIERILLNPTTPSEVFPDIAKVASEQISELIANNQAKLLQNTEIVRSLLDNDRAPKATKQRVVDFMVRNGHFLEGLREFEDAILRLEGKDRLEAVKGYEIPLEHMDEGLLSDEERKALEGGRQLIEEGENEEEDPLENLTLEEKLRRLPLPALVAYATKGNKMVRKTLMRSTNRVVALAAITSPMVQEPEVIEAAKSKNIHGDVVAHIARDKKKNWVKLYPVKVALVRNPKTPTNESMKQVNFLRKPDLTAVSRSKDVPMPVRAQATKLLKKR